MFIYSDNENRGTGSINTDNMDATSMYLRHFDNLLTLKFIFDNSKNRNEKCQCEKEMEIARRKMRFWEHKRNFDKVRMANGTIELKKKWK